MFTTGPVLLLNVGSSSVKVAVDRGGAMAERVSLPPNDHAALTAFAGQLQPVAVGHRLVHGGTKFIAPTHLTPEVIAELDRLAPLAPLHLPPALDVVRTLEQLLPGVPHFGCFDTAFHATLPEVETHFGLPRRYYAAGVRKYGFHGLSFQFIASRLPAVSARAAAGKTVVCHLGSGASVCGLLAGRSVFTSMGFSPLDGLLMRTRCGHLDPGVVLYLQTQEKQTPEEVLKLLSQESGLLGVSGISGDMKQLLDDPSPEAAFAVRLFCRMAAKEIAAAAVALGGLEALVFTAGIGEHSPAIRAGIVAELAWLGIDFDATANSQNAARLHAEGSRIEVYGLPTDEEQILAESVRALLIAVQS